VVTLPTDFSRFGTFRLQKWMTFGLKSSLFNLTSEQNLSLLQTCVFFHNKQLSCKSMLCIQKHKNSCFYDPTLNPHDVVWSQ
jgi:hypothetical protein